MTMAAIWSFVTLRDGATPFDAPPRARDFAPFSTCRRSRRSVVSSRELSRLASSVLCLLVTRSSFYSRLNLYLGLCICALK